MPLPPRQRTSDAVSRKRERISRTGDQTVRPKVARHHQFSGTLVKGFESRRPRQLQLPISNTPIPKQDFLGVGIWESGLFQVPSTPPRSLEKADIERSPQNLVVS